MAYSRQARRPDIRDLNIEKPTEGTTHQAPPTQAVLPKNFYTHHPGKELKTILLISLPLIALLALATYLDTTNHWVIPAAETILSIGK